MVIPSFTKKQQLIIVAILIALLAIIFWAISRYLSPSPPRSIEMTTGAADGAYHAFALRYQAYMKDSGIDLQLKTSKGSVENLERLNLNIPAGFVQGGLGQLSIDADHDEEKTPLRSLAVIGYEPVWIFASQARSTKLSAGLQQLAGAKVAVGAEGSGTRKVALDLLASFGQNSSTLSMDSQGGMAAAQALIDGKIDAAFFISATQGAAVQKLLNQTRIGLVALSQAEGLARRLPYLNTVVLKRGSVNPSLNLPAQDQTLLATTANLVVHKDIHPAIAYLLLEAAKDTHKTASLLHRPGDFPHIKNTDFPVADESQRYFKDGRPFLQRYLPFWLANAVQRLLLILIPLAAVAVPLIKLIPALLTFKDSNRLFRRYEELLKIEALLHSPSAELNANDQLEKIAKIEADIEAANFSLDFTDRVFTLRQHIDFVRHRLQNLNLGAPV